MRRFWRGDGGLIGEVAQRITGSADLYDRRGRRPWASVNFVTAHDGFTLQDLVSYNAKHNEANGEDNRDGATRTTAGIAASRAETDEPAILELRERQKRNMLATLLLSLGTPMLLAGDEIGNSQHGNNNAYCQDNEIGWINWPDKGDVRSGAVRLRPGPDRAAQEVPLCPRRQVPARDAGTRRQAQDVTWLRPDGQEMTEEDWSFPEARSLRCWYGASCPCATASRTPRSRTRRR